MTSRSYREEIKTIFRTLTKSPKIFNEYKNNLSLYGKVLNWMYVIIPVIAFFLYLYLKFGVIRRNLFINVGVLFNLVSIVSSLLQMARSYKFYISNFNTDQSASIQFRSIISIIMIIYILSLLYIFVATCPCCMSCYFYPTAMLYATSVSFFSQFLYNKTFSKFDIFHVVFFVSSIILPYVLDKLTIKIPLGFREYGLIINGVFMILSTIFDFKPPQHSSMEALQIIVIFFVLSIIPYDTYRYDSLIYNNNKK